MNDLERQLARQEFKPVPPEWRAGVLNAAHGARSAESARSSETFEELPSGRQERADSAVRAPAVGAWWRWVRSWPRAWASLAALWVLILFGQLTMPSVSSPPTAATVAYGASAAEAWRQQQELLAELFPHERTVEPVKTLPPRRRGERKTDLLFA